MKSFEDELNEDLIKRIEIIESSNYEFPPKFNKMDYIVVIITIFICLVGIVAGAFISM